MRVGWFQVFGCRFGSPGKVHKAALRELLRLLVFERRVRTVVVVVLAVFFAEHFCLQNTREAFPVQALVPKTAAEGRAVGVPYGLPRAM